MMGSILLTWLIRQIHDCSKPCSREMLVMVTKAFVVLMDCNNWAFANISHVHIFDILLQLGFPKHLAALHEALSLDGTVVTVVLS